jgi:hypothetical protein
MFRHQQSEHKSTTQHDQLLDDSEINLLEMAHGRGSAIVRV